MTVAPKENNSNKLRRFDFSDSSFRASLFLEFGGNETRLAADSITGLSTKPRAACGLFTTLFHRLAVCELRFAMSGVSRATSGDRIGTAVAIVRQSS